MLTLRDSIFRLVGIFGGAAALLSTATACGPGTVQLRTPRYTLSYPDYWEVKAQGLVDGAPTTLNITSYGDAVIDSGSGTTSNSSAAYDSVMADVEVRIYAWPVSTTAADPTEEILRLLSADPALELGILGRVPEQPPECGQIPRKFRVLGEARTTIDLVRKPKWRVILVGAQVGTSLVGALARVPFEQDYNRFCHHLRNMQTQFQVALDGLAVTAPAPDPAK